MSRKVRCAVLGVGRLGYYHAKNLVTQIPEAEVTYVVASRIGNAERVARELDIPKWTNNPNEVFENPEIDAVIIVTPTKTHASLIKEAAKNKKHIFVDKPITETLDEADDVIKAVQENNVFCQVGFVRRFDPAFAEAKKRIDSGDIGEPLYYKGVSRDPGSPPEIYIATSGGIFLDLCIHDFDVARYLLGKEVESIQSFGKVLAHPFMNKYGDSDQALSFIKFTNGASASIEGSRNAFYGYDIRGEVVGTEGAIQIGSIKYHDNLILTKGKSYHDNIPNFQTRYEEGFILELKHFIECVQNNEKPIVDEVDGKKALEIAIAATKSYQTKKEVKL